MRTASEGAVTTDGQGVLLALSFLTIRRKRILTHFHRAPEADTEQVIGERHPRQLCNTAVPSISSVHHDSVLAQKVYHLKCQDRGHCQCGTQPMHFSRLYSFQEVLTKEQTSYQFQGFSIPRGLNGLLHIHWNASSPTDSQGSLSGGSLGVSSGMGVITLRSTSQASARCR